MTPTILSQNSFRRVFQKENNCGPAVLEMLFSFFGHQIDQDTIADASGILTTVYKYGSRIDQLGKAVKLLFPQYFLLWKREAIINDIEYIINNFHIPIAVEWQSEFRSPEGICIDEGHYSIVIGVNRVIGVINIIDSSIESAYQDGNVNISDFQKRWWDTNIIYAHEQREEFTIIDKNLLFLLAPKELAELFLKQRFFDSGDYLRMAPKLSSSIMNIREDPTKFS